jgi:hypothetical protein
MTTTMIFVMDANKPFRFSAGFLHCIETETVEQARTRYADFAAAMLEPGSLEPGEIAFGVTFEGKTMDDIDREFPFYLRDGADEFDNGGHGHE